MKKTSIPVRFMSLICLFLVSAHVMLAETVKIDNIYYSLTSDSTASVMPCIENNEVVPYYTGDIIIPGEITTAEGKTYTVTEIGDDTFLECNKVTSVTMPNTIISIGYESFYGCTGISEFKLPESLQFIGGRAFSGMPLKSISIPKSCTHFSSDINRDPKFSSPGYSLSGLYQLENITVEEGNPAFASQDGMIVSADQTILYYFPEGRTGSFTTPDNIKTIAASAFSLSSLTDLTISPAVETLATTAFNEAKFEQLTFAGDKSTQPLDISTLYWTGGYIFSENLKNITLSRRIDGFFLRGNRSAIEYPFTVTIKDGFDYSDDVSVEFLSELNNYVTEYFVDQTNGFAYDGAYYQNDGEGSFIAFWPGVSSRTKPDFKTGCVGIGRLCFVYNTVITEVEIPETVKFIGYTAFSGCTSLNRIIIPKSVDYIGHLAFYKCSALTEINIPESVTYIGDYAFSGTSIESIEIGKNITYLGDYVCSDCPNLKHVKIYSGTVSDDGQTVTIPKRTFSTCRELESLYIGSKINNIDLMVLSTGTRITDIWIENPTPPACSSVCLGLGKNNICTLHVPIGCAEIYKETKAYSYFKNIVEYDFTGIEDNLISSVNIYAAGNNLIIEGNPGATIEVFSISGQNLYKGHASVIPLPTGTYIVRIGSFIRKISI